MILAAGWIAAGVTGCPSSGGGGAGDGGGAENGGDPNNPPDDDLTPDVDALFREIEEADIVKEDDGIFYLANRYRGLRIIDARDIDNPRGLGGPAEGPTGRGIELYVDDDRVIMVSSADFFACAGEPVSYDDVALSAAVRQPDYSGSRVSIFDVSNPANVSLVSQFDLDGFSTATRRVGDVIYVAGNFVGTVDDGDVNNDPDGDDDLQDDDSQDDNGADDEQPPPPSSTGSAAIVDELGLAGATATSPAGTIVGFDVALAAPGAFVQATAADGNLQAAYDGVPGSAALPITARIASNLQDGAFVATLTIELDGGLIADAGLSSETLAVYGYDEASALWSPAATAFQGMSDPTGVPGEFGYFIVDAGDDGDVANEGADGTRITVWAIVDQIGDFAIGDLFPDLVTLSADFDPGMGSVTITPLQGSYAFGDVVTLTAMPADGFAFDAWTGLPPDANEVADGVVEIRLTADTSVLATFAPISSVDFESQVFVLSINIADPNNIVLVDRVDVTGDSLDIHVSQNAIYVLGDDPTLAGTTRVNYIDISDPTGDIEPRDTFRVPGQILNRFFADEYAGTFRVLTEDENLSVPVVTLYVYDITDPDNVIRIGQATIDAGHTLVSVRFDGPRAYAATFYQDDPLYVLDLSDPFNPVVAGTVEAPGWSAFLTPLSGSRLLAVGFDEFLGFRPALMLYDVSDPFAPRRASRIILGESWTFSSTTEATVDEKALKVLEDAGLVLMPFGSFDRSTGQFVDSLQIIDLNPNSLRERGFIEHNGLVRRSGLLDGRLWVLSDESFQVADIFDRDNVTSVRRLDVMSDQDLLDAGLTDCVDSARLRGFNLGAPDVPFGVGGPVIGEVRGICGSAGMLGFAVPLSLMPLVWMRRRRRR